MARTTWQEHGKNMARTWQEHGNHMARTWQYHGKNMARTWQAHGKSMAITWQEHGKNMARARPEHAIKQNSQTRNASNKHRQRKPQKPTTNRHKHQKTLKVSRAARSQASKLGDAFRYSTCRFVFSLFSLSCLRSLSSPWFLHPPSSFFCPPANSFLLTPSFSPSTTSAAFTSPPSKRYLHETARKDILTRQREKTARYLQDSTSSPKSRA